MPAHELLEDLELDRDDVEEITTAIALDIAGRHEAGKLLGVRWAIEAAVLEQFGFDPDEEE